MTADQPLVSIIIPFYNRFDLLDNTLNSVLNQTYKNCEVILIDDFSDRVLNIDIIKERINFPVLKYERLLENIGPGGARRRGRELAEGNYIVYLDSDDQWDLTFLERTTEILQKHTSISMVFTGCITKSKKDILKKTNLAGGIHDYHNLVFKQKKSWATGSNVWRATISKSEYWKDFRDHEDFVHDILSTIDFSEIYHIPDFLCIVNKDKVRGINRCNAEMLKAFKYLTGNETLRAQLKLKNRSKEFSSFILFRMKRRKYNFKSVLDLTRIFIALLRFGNYGELNKIGLRIFLQLSR